jgi:hypothetical protein
VFPLLAPSALWMVVFCAFNMFGPFFLLDHLIAFLASNDEKWKGYAYAV